MRLTMVRYRYSVALISNVLSNDLIQSIFSPSSIFFVALSFSTRLFFCSLKNRFVMITHVINKLLKVYLNETNGKRNEKKIGCCFQPMCRPKIEILVLFCFFNFRIMSIHFVSSTSEN